MDPMMNVRMTGRMLGSVFKMMFVAFLVGAAATCGVLYRNPGLLPDPGHPRPKVTVTVTETPQTDPLRAPGSMP